MVVVSEWRRSGAYLLRVLTWILCTLDIRAFLPRIAIQQHPVTVVILHCYYKNKNTLQLWDRKFRRNPFLQELCVKDTPYRACYPQYNAPN